MNAVDVRTVGRDDLVAQVQGLLADGFRVALVAGHDDRTSLAVVYVLVKGVDDSRVELVVEVPADDAWVPSLAGLDFATGRWERALRDQLGVEPVGHPRPHQLVHHAHWPDDYHPLRHDVGQPEPGPNTGAFEFAPVDGDGVFEVPVGPVHAGMIAPGHFRFSVVGETILQMKARLWFVHRGMERLFQGCTPDEGIALAERVAGDTAVGHTLAYAMAVEDALGLEVAEQDRAARALLCELERAYNHVADLGMLGNDVGFGILNVHASRLRETLLRLNDQVTGHRLARGAISIGGTSLRSLPDPAVIRHVADEAAQLVDIALGHAVVVDRFTGTATLHHDDALALGTLGYVARASGVDTDARRDHPFYDLGAEFAVVTETPGDVMARFTVRARELACSLTLVTTLTEHLAGNLGSTSTAPLEPGPARRSGLSLVEGWRGTICHRVELDPTGHLARVAIADPSFANWPALSVALADTIVPDFPLANKSFNLSYSGNDL
ncbi:MAG: NADH-quinone oxidoreductase subunit C [Micrococcales bacterium]|nr:NADH-quinone oxidoreductase subunit C [Micrococcales bacterium]MCL2666348.1 NADH-quinone oxidoreductase subunit C [Micrococcales bacterium]